MAAGPEHVLERSRRRKSDTKILGFGHPASPRSKKAGDVTGTEWMKRAREDMKSEGSGPGLELWEYLKGVGLHVDNPVLCMYVKPGHILHPSSLCAPTILFSQEPGERGFQGPISRQALCQLPDGLLCRPLVPASVPSI